MATTTINGKCTIHTAGGTYGWKAQGPAGSTHSFSPQSGSLGNSPGVAQNVQTTLTYDTSGDYKILLLAHDGAMVGRNQVTKNLTAGSPPPTGQYVQSLEIGDIAASAQLIAINPANPTLGSVAIVTVSCNVYATYGPTKLNSESLESDMDDDWQYIGIIPLMQGTIAPDLIAQMPLCNDDGCAALTAYILSGTKTTIPQPQPNDYVNGPVVRPGWNATAGFNAGDGSGSDPAHSSNWVIARGYPQDGGSANVRKFAANMKFRIDPTLHNSTPPTTFSITGHVMLMQSPTRLFYRCDTSVLPQSTLFTASI